MKDESHDTLKHLMRIDIILLITLIAVAVGGIKDLIMVTRTTKTLSEVAQKVGVEFHTKTNNVLGIWQVIKPK